MPNSQLTEKHILGSDPLGKIFFNFFNLKPYGVALFFVFAGLLYGYIVPILLDIAPATDLITIINIILIFPIAGYFYAYQPTSILRIYQSIARFFKEENQAAIPFEKLQSWHTKSIWWILGMMIGLISAGFGVVSVFTGYGYGWEGINGWQIFLIYGTRFTAMSMIGMIVTRHIATSLALNSLFQYTDFPITLDTDNIEVFNTVKRFSLEIIGVAAVIALNLGLQPLVIEVPFPEYAFYVVLYFLLVPVTFFLPLWQVHRRMVVIKNNMLEKLHKDYQEEAEKLYEILAKDPKKDLSSSYLKQTESMVAIKQAVELINRSPDWPFQGTTIYRLAVTSISPFTFTFLETLINWISNFMRAI